MNNANIDFIRNDQPFILLSDYVHSIYENN